MFFLTENFCFFFRFLYNIETKHCYEKSEKKKRKYYMEPHVSDSLKFTDDVFERMDSVGEDKFEEFVVSSLVG